MKPSFALDLRDERVTLLHRTSRGWHEVGSTRFDAPDLTEALAYMRATALGLSPRGISTKLIIPNDQILYTQVTATGSDAGKRRRQVKSQLDGLTPYPVEDLAYDIWGPGPDVQVAVVARETLDQAEAFASEHRFNPVSCVAVPDNGLFKGEAFFGPSKMSPALLSEGERVDRDNEPVDVVARDRPKAAEREAAPPPPEPAEAAPVVEPPASAPVDAVPAEAATPVVAAEAFPPVPPVMPVAEPEPAVIDATAPAPVEVEVEEAPIALDVAAEEPPAPVPTAAALRQSLAAVPDLPPGAEDDIPPAPAETIRAALAARRAEANGKAPSLGAATIAPAAAATRLAPTRPVGAIDAPPPLKASLAAALPVAKPAGMTGRPGKPSAPGKALKNMGAMVTAPGIPGMGRRKVAAAPAAAPSRATPLPGKAAPTAPGTTRPMSGLGGQMTPMRGKPRYLGLILTGVLLVFLALIAAWSSFFMAGLGTDQAAPSKTAISQAETPITPATTATATTAPADQTAAATPSNATSSGGQEATARPATTATAAADPATATAAATGTAASDTALPLAGAAAVASAATADAAAPATAAPAATPATDTAAAAPAAASTETTASTAPAPEPAPGTVVSTEAASGQAQPQSTGDGAADQIKLAAVEPPTALADPATLPAPASGSDALPEAAPEPPPFGTVYKFDANGLIVPTPEGIVTPEGVLLVAGKPKVVPPDRPAAIAALAPAPMVTFVPTDPAPDAAQTDSTTAPAAGEIGTTAPAEATTTATPGAIPLTGTAATPAPTPDATPAPAPDATPTDLAAPLPQDPALKGFRPRARPATLVPASAAPIPFPPPDPALAGAKPRARSAAVTAAADAAGASTAGLQGTPSTADEAASDLAVNTSRLPIARPAGMAQAVSAAVTEALATPEIATVQDTSANVAPEAQAEPDVTTAAPRIPTSASVAKTATDKNALALSKVALIGVFGSDSARYAYVRLPNGSLKKVKVGDPLDGGQVVAISANELRYQKSGKMVVLQMPSEG